MKSSKIQLWACTMDFLFWEHFSDNLGWSLQSEFHLSFLALYHHLSTCPLTARHHKQPPTLILNHKDIDQSVQLLLLYIPYANLLGPMPLIYQLPTIQNQTQVTSLLSLSVGPFAAAKNNVVLNTWSPVNIQPKRHTTTWKIADQCAGLSWHTQVRDWNLP